MAEALTASAQQGLLQLQDMTMSVQQGLTDRASRKADFSMAVERMVHVFDLPIDLIAKRGDGQARRLGIVDQGNWTEMERLVRSTACRNVFGRVPTFASR